MAINYPGPFDVRINYLTNEPSQVAQHQIRVSCDCPLVCNPGDAFTAWFPVNKAGSNVINLDTKVNDFLVELKKHFISAVTFQNAELWEYTPGTFDAAFRSTKAIGAAGTGTGTTRDGGQVIWTWRTANGGILKLDLRGSLNAAGVRVALPGTGDVAARNTYMLASTTPWIARDGSFPVAGLFFAPGQNENAFKKLYR